MKLHQRILSGVLAALMLLSGCSAGTKAEETVEFVDVVPMEIAEIADEAVALAEVPAAPQISLLTPTASGTAVKKTAKAEIDYSHTSDGYVMVKFTANTTKKLRAQVKGPATTYTYHLTAGKWEVFPLSDGNGSYTVVVYENVSGNSYSSVASVKTNVELTDEFSPFLYPNQYVDYGVATNAVAKAAELTKDIEDPLKKVEAVYNYVIRNVSYDKKKAQTVTSGYLPVLDETLQEKKGICFDYASLMTGMLRSQGVPCKLVVGYAGTAYHAWISVWTEKDGWIDGVIFFNGTAWQRMDPTFASSGKSSASILKYIGDGSHYTVKYLY